jgi:hypothetical protein
VHDYYFPLELAVNGWTFLSYLQHIAELAQEAGVKEKPVWITETGFISAPVQTNGRVDEGTPS